MGPLRCAWVLLALAIAAASGVEVNHPPQLVCENRACSYVVHETDNVGHPVPGTENVYIGTTLAARNYAWLDEFRIRHVISVREEIPLPHRRPGIFYTTRSAAHIHHKEIMDHVVEVHKYIEKTPLREGILIVDETCLAEAPMFALGHMMLSDWDLGLEDAESRLKESRSVIKPYQPYMVELENLDTTLYVYKLNRDHHRQNYLSTIKDDL